MLVMPVKKRLFSWTHLLSELQLILSSSDPQNKNSSSWRTSVFLLIVPLPVDPWLHGPQLCAPSIVAAPQLHSSQNTH